MLDLKKCTIKILNNPFVDILFLKLILIRVCTCLVIWNNLLICGFNNGLITLYDIANGKII